MNEETNKLLIDLQVKAQNVELQYNILRGKYAALEQENEENKKTINELKIKNAELSNSVTELTNSKTELENKVTELEKQIEKMKCCGNCKHNRVNEEDNDYCLNCDRPYGEIAIQDEWELAE